VAELVERGVRAIGVDLDPAMLTAARERFPGADVRAADATALPLADGGFTDVTFEVHTAILTKATTRLLLARNATAARDTGAITAAEAEQWIAEQEQRAATGRLMPAIPMFLAAGSR
jgi:SAM-dependent methyltransferase